MELQRRSLPSRPRGRLRGADTVIFDGTLAAFMELGVRRKILIHLNNSNPILLDDSPERAEVVRAGWQIAFDRMRIAV